MAENRYRVKNCQTYLTEWFTGEEGAVSAENMFLLHLKRLRYCPAKVDLKLIKYDAEEERECVVSRYYHASKRKDDDKETA